MKQILLLVLAALPLSVCAQNNTTRKTYTKEFKKEFIDACITAATQDGAVTEKMATETCNCSFDLLSDKYTMNQINTMFEENPDKSRKLLMETTAPCRDEMVRKLKAEKK